MNYFDKNGNQIKAGMDIRMADGSFERVYETTDAYYYTIKGNEMFFTRKEKSVTRATVNIALQTAIKLQKDGIQITGPKMLGCFGASYLYPIFIRIGVISISDGDKKT